MMTDLVKSLLLTFELPEQAICGHPAVEVVVRAIAIAIAIPVFVARAAGFDIAVTVVGPGAAGSVVTIVGARAAKFVVVVTVVGAGATAACGTCGLQPHTGQPPLWQGMICSRIKPS